MLTVLNVAGARPNFMKIAPLHRAMVTSGEIRPVFVHTGQHYDDNMSQVFLEEFDLPEPQFALGVGSGTHAEQTARVMLAIEPVIEETKPDVVLVVGDVNSTVAATLTAVKLGVATAHVEAGLRSFDRAMPEEINRLLTDAIADFLFAPSRDGMENLRREGIPDERIFFVGNVMIDTLLTLESRARCSTILEALGLKPRNYVVATLHRPSNVDNAEALTSSIEALERVGSLMPVVLVAHPRTQARLDALGLLEQLRGRVTVMEPLGYLDFLKLMMESALAVTDSGGIQEETTVIGVPCVTMRENTERPITVSEGTNRVVGRDPTAVIAAVEQALGEPRRPHRPELWDGRASGRIAQVLLDALGR